MNLAELEYQTKAYISKVNGDEEFKKRISEMGFIKGQEISLVKSSPFKGPHEYEILGYKVSLRKDEAEMVEIIPEKKPINFNITGIILEEASKNDQIYFTNDIKIAFVGNPNSGKTSLFNKISNSKEKVGNYGGVTIESKTAFVHKEGYNLSFTDLPGTYSLTEFTPEEKYVRMFLEDEKPDIVVNVIDASNLERNLYLTTQLIDMGCQVIVAVNMYDEILNEGIKFNLAKFSKLLNVNVVPTIATKGIGISELHDEIIKFSKKTNLLRRKSRIDYGEKLENLIQQTEKALSVENVNRKFTRYQILKIIEQDQLSFPLGFPKINKTLWDGIVDEIKELELNYDEGIQGIITNSRYQFIHNVLGESIDSKPVQKQKLSEKIDNVLLHKLFGLPIFLAFMFITFWATFTLGSFPMAWIESGFAFLGHLAEVIIPAGLFQDLMVNGVISGIGGVMVFLPNIVILFLFISFMEDSGYMARASFIMDNFMHKIGLHGKSFIPLIVGFGCNVPAIMATRTIRDKKDRYITMLMIPFMSCSARLPVYVLVVGAFFPKYPALVIFGLYIFGIILSVVLAKFVNLTIFKKKISLFVLELPPYRMPTSKTVVLNMWFKASQYVKKIGKIILVASVIIWALSYFPQNNLNHNSEKLNHENSLDKSYLGQFGKAISPVLEPLGFDWKLSVSLLSGLVAKEVIISSMNIIYNVDESHLNEQLKAQSGLNPLVALAFLVFILIYLPCISVVSTLYKEGGWKIAMTSVVMNTSIAWIAAFLVYQVGSLM